MSRPTRVEGNRMLAAGWSLLCGGARLAAERGPASFRRMLAIDPRRPSEWFSEELQPWQERDFGLLDGAWEGLVHGRAAHPGVLRRAYRERPRGHSKTTDTAVQLAWVLIAARKPLNGLVAAADLEQAQLVQRALQRLARANPHLLGGLQFLESSIRNPASGCLLKVISSDVRSSWGELPDFVICDELCHWKSADLWYSLLSSAAKKPESVMLVLSNAGVGRGWQWAAREAARTDPAWCFSTLPRPQAPWITEESLEEQRRLLPPAVFARLWLNQWQHSDGEFVSLAEASACRDEALAPRHEGEPGRDYVASIDYAEKHDLTVGCICHREGAAILVDRMDVVRPSPLRATPVRWVSDWIHSVASAFPGVRFILDPHQLVSVIQSLESRFPIERYGFRGGQGNFEMAITLRQLILERQVRWYRGCGTVPGEEGLDRPDDLERELASLVIREQSGGRFRFDHRNDGEHHDDRSFALGVACQALVEHPAGGEVVWDIVSPEQGGLLG
ncbi:Phage Terminase [Caulifigura coniformis]|uniref:Phage Terminase n=1 Tax=Caulifigura coniformis TaxID=2527983 RepID=A0A517S7X4_9PLAN|nr:terminase large subunit [Caulifigura coniformis]QDT52229.1 Phage Terminase [Caulifigura coniformis]